MIDRIRYLKARLGQFRDDLRGTMSVELVLVLPILFWAYAAMLVFYDAYRARMEAQSAALHIADLVSRHPGMIEADYLEGLNDVFDFLTSRNRQTRLRVSSVMLDMDTMEPAIVWSYGTRGLPSLNALSDYVYMPDPDNPEDPPTGFDNFDNQLPVSDLASRIPIVLPGEALILVEAFTLWSNPIISGLGAGILNDVRLAPIAVTRPRFSPFVRFEGDGDIFPELPPELLPPTGEPVGPEDPEEPAEPEDPADQTVTIVDTDFNDGDTDGWSHSTVTDGGLGSALLGPFGQETWQNPVTYQVNLGAQSRSAEIEFDLWIIDSWDGFSTQYAHPEGEFLTILVNGTAISLDPFQWGPGMMTLERRTVSSRAEGRFTTTMELVEVAQAYGAHWQDQRWRVRIEVENPATELATEFTLGFAARLDAALQNESFGIDRFRITAERGSWGPMHFVPDFDSRIGTDPLTRFRTYSGCPERRIPAATMPMLNSDLSEPIRMRRSASGANGIGNCGLPGADRYNTASPTLVVDYVNDTSDINGNRLRIRTQDNNSGNSCDAALLIRDPYGQYYYNDTLADSWTNVDYNARVNLGHATTGRYTIWMGHYFRETCQTDLRFERY